MQGLFRRLFWIVVTWKYTSLLWKMFVNRISVEKVFQFLFLIIVVNVINFWDNLDCYENVSKIFFYSFIFFRFWNIQSVALDYFYQLMYWMVTSPWWGLFTDEPETLTLAFIYCSSIIVKITDLTSRLHSESTLFRWPTLYGN